MNDQVKPVIYQLTIKIQDKDEDLVAEQLFALGATSASSSISKNNSITVTALFNKRPDLENILGHDRYSIKELSEDEWKYRWAENYRGCVINDRIHILPHTSMNTISSKPLNAIFLDHRDAFGDGGHPTTSMCLIALENYFKQYSDTERSKLIVLDMGTGTGILAIYSSLMGVDSIDAVDIDPAAVVSAQFNARINNCNNINFINCGIESFDTKKTYDLVIANLLTDHIQKNLHTLISFTKNNGIMLLSGISSQWHADMLSLFDNHTITVHEHTEKDNWNCYVIRKGNNDQVPSVS